MSSSNIQSVQKLTSVKAVNGRTRLLGVYFSHTATPATLTLKNGSNSGSAKLTMTTPSSAGSQDLIIPDTGILFEDGIFISLSAADITSVTLLFEGGAPA